MRFGAPVARLVTQVMRLPWLGALIQRRGQEEMWRSGFRAHPLHRAQLSLVLAHVVGLDFQELRRAASRLPEGLPVLCAWAAHDPLIEEAISEELAAALKAHVKERLAPYKYPRSFEWRAEPLPRNDRGKVARKLLK